MMSEVGEMGGFVPSAVPLLKGDKYVNDDNMTYRAAIETGVVALR